LPPLMWKKNGLQRPFFVFGEGLHVETIAAKTVRGCIRPIKGWVQKRPLAALHRFPSCLGWSALEPLDWSSADEVSTSSI